MKLAAVLAALVLAAGCQTLSEEQRPVSAQDSKLNAGAGKPGAEARAVERPNVAALDVTAARNDPARALKDPASTLSKRSIFFRYDRFDIEDEYRPIIEAHAKHLREHPDARMLIQGNADERGSREYNVGLGQRRSDNVKRLLMLLGAKEGQIESVSLGEEKPRCSEHGEDCWSKNRRGDILYGSEY